MDNHLKEDRSQPIDQKVMDAFSLLSNNTRCTFVKYQYLHDLALSKIRLLEHQYWVLLSRVLSVQPRLLLTKNTGRLRIDQHILSLAIQALEKGHDVHDTLLFLDPRTQSIQPSQVFSLIKSAHKHSTVFATKYFNHNVNKRFLSKHITSFIELSITDTSLLRSFLFQPEFKEDYIMILKYLGHNADGDAYLPPQKILFTSIFRSDRFVLLFIDLLVEMVGNERSLTFAIFEWAFGKVTESSGKSSLLFWLDSKGANQQRNDELHSKQVIFYRNLLEWCISNKDYELLTSTTRVSYYSCVDKMTDIIQTKDAQAITCLVSMAIKARQLDKLLLSTHDIVSNEDVVHQIARSLKECIAECAPMQRLQGLKYLCSCQTMHPRLVTALAHFHDTKSFVADFSLISQIEQRLFHEGHLGAYSELLESGVPAQYHWLDAPIDCNSLEGARLGVLLSHMSGNYHSMKRSIDALTLFDDFDWIKHHIRTIHPHAGNAQKKAIAKLFVLNNHFEELLSRHCVSEVLLLRTIPTNVVDVKKSRRKVAQLLMDKYPHITDTERSFLLKLSQKEKVSAQLCASFEKIVANNDYELWPIIAPMICVDEHCIRVFGKHNNPELWSLLLEKDHNQKLLSLVTEKIGNVNLKTMQLLAKHLEHELIDESVLENDRFLPVRIEHYKKSNLDLKDILSKADLTDECLTALAAHLTSDLNAVSPNLPCYHVLISVMLQICGNDRLKIIEHFVEGHEFNARNSLIWRTLTKFACWNDQLVLLCLNDMARSSDIQVLETLIRKRWPILERHIPLLFDIMKKMEQSDALLLADKLSKHRKCKELIPIFTSVLLRCLVSPNRAKLGLNRLLKPLSQRIPTIDKKKRKHRVTFVDRMLRLAMASTSEHDSSVFKSSLENSVSMWTRSSAGC